MKKWLEGLKLRILSNVGYFLYLGSGLVLFFVFSFLVVVFRTKSPTKITVPNLLGRNYIEVHNELVRLGLKVKLNKVKIPEINDGEILDQSISAGKTSEMGSKIYLTVNEGFDRVTIPDVRGITLKNAKAALEKVLASDVYVNLEIGGITYLERAPGQSPEAVLEQIPEPGTVAKSTEKIYLLVTESEEKLSKNLENLSNMPLEFVASNLNQKKIPFKISNVENCKVRSASGLVQKLNTQANPYLLDVCYVPFSESTTNGYELFETKLDDTDNYNLEKLENGKTIPLMLSTKFQEDEKLKFVFYRRGASQIFLKTNEGKTIEKEKYKPTL